MSQRIVPDPMDVWPGRAYTWSAAPIDPRLRAAIRARRGATVMCVNAVINGRRVRWSTRNVEIPCAEVQGGVLMFRGKLVGDGEYRSSISLSSRVADVATFDVDADNAAMLGLAQSDASSQGQYVVPLAGGRVEISVAHPDADWSARYVSIYGTAASASYGADGETLRFTVVPIWRGIDRVAMPSIDAQGFPAITDLEDPAIGKAYPLGVGALRRHRVIRIGDPAAPSRYLVNGIPLGTTVQEAYDSDDLPVTYPTNVVRVKDGYGRWIEVIDINSSDDEMFVDARTDLNGFLGWRGTNVGSMGSLVTWLLARLGAVSSADIDLAGAAEYSALYLHAYGMSVGEDVNIADLLEERIVQQTYGYTSMRRGRYGFRPFPLSNMPGTPAVRAHLVWGRELRARSAFKESDSEDLHNQFKVSWRENPSSGEYDNYNAGISNTVDSTNSFWSRVCKSLFGEAAGVAYEYPDLWKWYDCRSVLRADERFGALILRSIDYTCTPEVLGISAGDVVAITDPREGFYAKEFFVTSIGVSTRPVFKLFLLEWPGAKDLFGVYGFGSGPSGGGGGGQ